MNFLASFKHRATREVFSWLLSPFFHRFTRFAHRRRVSAICARNIASIIGQADSPLIKSGQGPFLFRARSTDLSISRTVYPTSSFLNLVTSDTGSIDWLQIKANLSKVEVFEEHRAAAATRTISIPSCLLPYFLLLPIPSAFLINF